MPRLNQIPPSLRFLLFALVLFQSFCARADLFIAQQSPPALLHYNPTNRVLIGTAPKPDGYTETFDHMIGGPDGNVYVFDNSLGSARVLLYDGQSGLFSKFFVDYNTNYPLFSVSAAAFGPDRNLYVCTGSLQDSLRHFFRFDGRSGAYLGQFGVPGQGNLAYGADMAFGPGGDLYVLDATQGVLRFSGLDGHFINLFLPLGSNSFNGLAFNPTGDLFLSGTNRVLRFNGTDGSALGTFAVSTTSPFLTRLAFGYDASLYVCGTNSVLRFNAVTGAYLDTFLMPPGAPANSPAAGVALTPPPTRNIWTNPASGNWQDLSWSLGVRPTTNHDVMITNANSKAVGIFPGIPATYASNMVVSNLTIAAPAGSVNTLLLNYSGTAIPLTVLGTCTVGSNGILNIQYGSVIASGAGYGSDDRCHIMGTVLQTGGFWSVPNGTMTLDFGNVNINGDCNFLNSDMYDGVFNQSGGQATFGYLRIYRATYNLTNGVVQGAINVSGHFNQYGGTVLSPATPVEMDFGTYTLFNGTLHGDIGVGASQQSFGFFQQVNGLVEAGSIAIGTFRGSGNYSLTNGTVHAGELSLLGGNFNQYGGICTVTNTLDVFGLYDDYGPSQFPQYLLSAGSLSCSNIMVSNFGGFTQTGGTNTVTSYLLTDRSGYSLQGGTLSTANLFVRRSGTVSGAFIIDSSFSQSSGLCTIANTLSNLDQLTLTGGTLGAKDILTAGTMTIAGNLPAPVINNSGTFTLSGSLNLGNSTQQLGRLIAAGNSTITFPSNNSVLRFLDSHTSTWTNGATLTLTNWNGSTNGGGASQLYVGSNNSGLTPAQLLRFRFSNPAGFAPGTWYASQLNTGEIVPNIRPYLATIQQGSNLVFSWPGAFTLQSATNVQGPYLNVIGATSPYTNTLKSQPRQFFRLKQ
jgi:hypothetical protein